MIRANATVSITRGRRIDSEYLDAEDIPVIIYTNVPVFIREYRARRSADGGTTVRDASCHLPSGIDVLQGDRVMNEKTGATYVVMHWTRSMLQNAALILDMEKVSGAL